MTKGKGTSPSYDRAGVSTPVLPVLKARLRSIDPVSHVALLTYETACRDHVEKRTTYNGVDASKEVLFHLCEALLALTQCRLEVADQIEQHQGRGEDAPPRIFIVTSLVMGFEVALMALITKAVDLHCALWGIDRDQLLSSMGR